MLLFFKEEEKKVYFLLLGFFHSFFVAPAPTVGPKFFFQLFVTLWDPLLGLLVSSAALVTVVYTFVLCKKREIVHFKSYSIILNFLGFVKKII